MMVGVGMFDETVFLLSSAREDEGLRNSRNSNCHPSPPGVIRIIMIEEKSIIIHKSLLKQINGIIKTST
jgi:hypothetical protein